VAAQSESGYIAVNLLLISHATPWPVEVGAAQSVGGPIQPSSLSL